MILYCVQVGGGNICENVRIVHGVDNFKSVGGLFTNLAVGKVCI